MFKTNKQKKKKKKKKSLFPCAERLGPARLPHPSRLGFCPAAKTPGAGEAPGHGGTAPSSAPPALTPAFPGRGESAEQRKGRLLGTRLAAARRAVAPRQVRRPRQHQGQAPGPAAGGGCGGRRRPSAGGGGPRPGAQLPAPRDRSRARRQDRGLEWQRLTKPLEGKRPRVPRRSRTGINPAMASLKCATTVLNASSAQL